MCFHVPMYYDRIYFISIYKINDNIFLFVFLKYTMKDVEKETCVHCADEKITDVV